jgi:hypothetical protein
MPFLAIVAFAFVRGSQNANAQGSLKMKSSTGNDKQGGLVPYGRIPNPT